MTGEKVKGRDLAWICRASTYTVFGVLAAVSLSVGCSQGRTTDVPGRLAWSNCDGIYICDFSERYTGGEAVFSDRSISLGLTMSSGGSYVCFTSYEWPGAGKEDVHSLLRLRLEDRSIDTLISGSQHLGDPSFSPDNTKIAFHILGKDRVTKGRYFTVIGPPEASCAVIDVKTKEYRVLTQPYLFPSTPSWTPDGNNLCVTTYEGRIVRIDLEGRELETYGRGLHPALSPDGRYLAYLDLDRRSICVVDLERGTRRVLTSRFTYHAPLDDSPKIRWSPDSNYLLYECWTGANRMMGWSCGFVVIPAHRKGLPIALGTNTHHAYGVDWVP